MNEPDEGEKRMTADQAKGNGIRRRPSNSGRRLNRKWNVYEEWNVKEENSRYHRDGTFFTVLREFPGALFDCNGFVVFSTETAYRTMPGLKPRQRINVPGGIASLPGYIKKRDDKGPRDGIAHQ
jgi:hypothetical protein